MVRPPPRATPLSFVIPVKTGIQTGKNLMATAKRTIERICEFGDVRRPVIEIPVDHGPPITLGPRGAKAILENLEAIRSFAARQEVTKHAIEQMCERGIGEEATDA